MSNGDNFPTNNEYASVDVQAIANLGSSVMIQQQQQQQQLYRSLKQQHRQHTYNLGNYFPRVASEPPTRKSYRPQREVKVGYGVALRFFSGLS